MYLNDQNLNNRTNNFDLLRLLASLLILFGHAPLILNGRYYESDPFIWLFDHGMHAFGLVVFFVISGFLVARSWENKPSVTQFLRARIVRLYPGLIVMTLLFVFVIGPLLTTVDLDSYFTSVKTYKYLANATLVRITYELPGVFVSNPIGSGINGSLWSLPYEFFCYFIILGIGLLGLIKQNKYIYLLLLFIGLIGYWLFADEINKIEIPIIALRLRVFAQYLLYFLAGAAYYHWRSVIPWHWIGALAAVVYCCTLHVVGISDLWAVFVLPYFILYLAIGFKPILRPLLRWGDLSFGICLYAFPIQQTLVYFFPHTFSTFTFILATLVLVFPMAYLSWNFVEKPAMRWKK